jgi:predicted ATPase/DNA-binding CsgD family transcriptional regulator
MRNRFADGVWLVDFAQLGEQSVELDADVPATMLRRTQALLVLDTCEYRHAACTELTRRLLQESELLQILATSRAPLGIHHEILWRVPPLSLPETNNLPEMRSSEAVQLFVQRSAATLGGFALTTQNAADVARVCHDMDGIPLGLELVAYHMAGLGLGELAQRVHTHLGLALTGRRDAPARHQTLRGNLDWSYALLSDDEQLLLRRLAVFVGGWTTEAAEIVCGDEHLTRDSVGKLLRRLKSKSMVLPAAPDEQRYRFHDVARLYALDKLVEAGEWRSVGRRHLLWCRALAAQARHEVGHFDYAHRVELELENLGAALDWAITTGDAESGLHVALGVIPLWFRRGQLAEVRSWLDRLLRLTTDATDPSLRCAATAWQGQVLALAGEFARAETVLEREIDRQQRLGNAAGVGFATFVLANASVWRGQLHYARGLLRQALTGLIAADSPVVDIALSRLWRVCWELGEATTVAEADRWAAQIASTRAYGLVLIWPRLAPAVLAAEAGDLDSALSQIDDTLKSIRASGDRLGITEALVIRGRTLLSAKRPAAALAAYQEAAQLLDSWADRAPLTQAVEGVGCALAVVRPEVAVRIIAAAAEQRARVGTLVWPRDRRNLDDALARAKMALGAEAFALAWRLGRSMLEADAVALAIEQTNWPSTPAALTRRELEVVRMIAAAISPSQIGRRLVISPATVRTHLERAMTKLGIHSRVQLARWAADPQNSSLFAKRLAVPNGSGESLSGGR